ncbi:MAG: glycosyltransferase family 39 protein [Herpetosiphon sp.]
MAVQTERGRLLQVFPVSYRYRAWLLLRWAFFWFAIGCVAISLAYQIPVRHRVLIGQNDGGYIQGWNDANNRWGVITDRTGVAGPVRWTKASSYIVFPLIGSPSELTIHWRAYRASPARTTLRVVLNGTQELSVIPGTNMWATNRLPVTPAFLKPDDLFIELNTQAPVRQGDEIQGVQVDNVELATVGWPIIPAMGQVLQGGAVLALLATTLRRARWLMIGLGIMVVAWLSLYRMDIIGFPLLHLLRWTIVAECTWLSIRGASHAIARVRPGYAHVGVMVLLVLWLIGVAGAARQHTVLSTPGVEKDFRVFAQRSNALSCAVHAPDNEEGCVLRADGFYQLGYPLILWIVRPLTYGNAFLAAQLVGLGAGIILLGATYLIGSRLGGRWVGLAAAGVAAANPLSVQYALLLGTDMVFAAAWTLALAAMVWWLPMRGPARGLAAGATAGVAYAIRHPGIILLPLGLAYILIAGRQDRRGMILQCCYFVAGWLVLTMPQLAVNIVDTGQPFFSEQAKNVWLAVYGNTEWGRWSEASNHVGLAEIVRQEPVRFFNHWLRNVVGFAGTGAEDTSEAGSAWMFRLLGFPANLLAAGGLARWMVQRRGTTLMLAFAAAIYAVAVGIGFLLLRFFVPLIGIWAVAAVMFLHWAMQPRVSTGRALQFRLLAGVALALVLISEAPQGVRAVTERQGEADVEMVAAIRRLVPDGELVQPQLAGDEMEAKYSSIAHRFGANGTQFVLWSDRSGRPQPRGGKVVATSGHYSLYRTGGP